MVSNRQNVGHTEECSKNQVFLNEGIWHSTGCDVISEFILFYAITVLQKKVGADPKNDWKATGSERKTAVLLSSARIMRMHFEDKWK